MSTVWFEDTSRTLFTRGISDLYLIDRVKAMGHRYTWRSVQAFVQGHLASEMAFYKSRLAAAAAAESNERVPTPPALGKLKKLYDGLVTRTGHVAFGLMGARNPASLEFMLKVSSQLAAGHIPTTTGPDGNEIYIDSAAGIMQDIRDTPVSMDGRDALATI
eukprot:SAG31_NODE_12484_length_938_cov_1.290822_2_plen_160_part_01